MFPLADSIYAREVDFLCCCYSIDFSYLLLPCEIDHRQSQATIVTHFPLVPRSDHAADSCAFHLRPCTNILWASVMPTKPFVTKTSRKYTLGSSGSASIAHLYDCTTFKVAEGCLTAWSPKGEPAPRLRFKRAAERNIDGPFGVVLSRVGPSELKYASTYLGLSSMRGLGG